MSEFAVECLGLTKTYGKRTVLNEITFGVKAGSILALVGSNGAGKTTLLKILATLVLPSAGRAVVCGEDLFGDSFRIKANVGFVSSEERSFYWRLTGKRNLDFFAALHGLFGADRKERIDDLLEVVGLKEYGNVRFREYSTGMKQSLAIARGMLHDPPVLLLDEPTRSLSPDVAKRICGLLRAKAAEEGKAVLIASHNLGEVETLADEIAILHRGTIRAVGSLPELHGKAGLPEGGNMGAVFHHFTREDVAS